MALQIAGLLTTAELEALCEVLNRPELLADGSKTAGWQARPRKRNLQAIEDTPLVRGALRKVEAALRSHEVFLAAARPKSIAKLLFSRYEPGMRYGAHVDDAVIAGQRSDLSFTLFLSAPDSYDGGELVIDHAGGESAFKPPAGHLILYPATTLHRVEPVTKGVRLAAVGWVRSFIRDEGQRELLFDIDQAVQLLRDGGERDRVMDLILKTRSNLLRRWAED